jgi:hypothetical protein
MRRDVARTVISAPPEFTKAMPHGLFVSMEKMAGEGTTTARILRENLTQRALVYGGGVSPVGLGELLSLRDQLRQIPGDQVITRDSLLKLAEALDELDEEHAELNHRTHRLPTPEEVCYAITPSQAHNIRGVMIKMANGRVVDCREVEQRAPYVRQVLETMTGKPCAVSLRDALTSLTPTAADDLETFFPGVLP